MRKKGQVTQVTLSKSRDEMKGKRVSVKLRRRLERHVKQGDEAVGSRVKPVAELVVSSKV